MATKEYLITTSQTVTFSTFNIFQALVTSLSTKRLSKGVSYILQATSNITATATISLLDFQKGIIIDLNGYTYIRNNGDAFNIQGSYVTFKGGGKILSNKTAGTKGIVIWKNSFLEIDSANPLQIGENGNNNGFNYGVQVLNNSYADCTNIIINDNNDYGFYAAAGGRIYRYGATGSQATLANITIGTLSADGSFIY